MALGKMVTCKGNFSPHINWGVTVSGCHGEQFRHLRFSTNIEHLCRFAVTIHEVCTSRLTTAMTNNTSLVLMKSQQLNNSGNK